MENLISNEFELLHNYKGHTKSVTCLSFHPKGGQLSSGAADNNLVVWNLTGKQRSYKYIGHTQSITCVEYSPNGKLIATASCDQTVRLWTPRLRGKCAEFRAHSSTINTIAFTGDGKRLATGANDKIIKFWSLPSQQFSGSLCGHTNWVKALAICPTDKYLISCADDRTARVWDLGQNGPRSRTQALVLRCLVGTPTCVSWHHSGVYAALGMSTGAIRIYDLRYTTRLKQLYELHEHCISISWHAQENYILSAGSEGKLILIDAMEGRPIYTMKSGDRCPITCARFGCGSSGMDYFAYAESNGHIFVWKTDFTMR